MLFPANLLASTEKTIDEKMFPPKIKNVKKCKKT